MEGLYPYSSPLILTDNIFIAYGGHTGTTQTAQRNAAYWLAEKKVSEELDTFLVNTTVTGTFTGFTSPIGLRNSYINEVLLTQFIGFDGDVLHSVSGTSNDSVSLRNQYFGLVDIATFPSCGLYSYQTRIVYTTGLSSGTSYSPDILLALTTYADIMINEIVGYGNEAPGDIGVQDFQNQQYRETRVTLSNTVFGNSPRAIFCHKLLKPYKRYKMVGM